MRVPELIQLKEFSYNKIKYHNYTFLNYINRLLKDYQPYEEFDYEDDDFMVPGRIEISIDGKTAYIDAQSDIIIALYKLINIRTDVLLDKYEEELEDEIDLRMYTDII